MVSSRGSRRTPLPEGKFCGFLDSAKVPYTQVTLFTLKWTANELESNRRRTSGQRPQAFSQLFFSTVVDPRDYSGCWWSLLRDCLYSRLKMKQSHVITYPILFFILTKSRPRRLFSTVVNCLGCVTQRFSNSWLEIEIQMWRQKGPDTFTRWTAISQS